MTAIAEAAAPRRSASRASCCDRAEVLGPLFIAPAILYIVRAGRRCRSCSRSYYSVSDYTSSIRAITSSG